MRWRRPKPLPPPPEPIVVLSYPAAEVERLDVKAGLKVYEDGGYRPFLYDGCIAARPKPPITRAEVVTKIDEHTTIRIVCDDAKVEIIRRTPSRPVQS